MNNPSASQDFFVAGGTLRYDAPSYVVRPADGELHRLVQAGKLCYVLTTRQMGKSSLMNRLGRQLQTEGIATALIDLTAIGTATLDEWYLSLLDDLQFQLELETDAEMWWEEQAALSPVKRFTNFFRDVVMVESDRQVAVFIDEVDSALNLDFSDDFFAAIRAIYNQTLTAEDAGRLSIILLGVAAPNDLIKSQHRTPFNIGERIALEELDLADARSVFMQGMPKQTTPIVDRVYYWTSGHPYLTQRICQTIARDSRSHWTADEIDAQIAQLFFTDRSMAEESNLQFVNGRLLASPRKKKLLHLYKNIHRKRKRIPNDDHDPLQFELKLYGLISRQPEGHVDVRNHIYRQVFDQSWIKQHQETNWKRITWIALVFTTLLSIGLMLYLGQQTERSDDLLAQTYRDNFNATENPTLRLDNLAQLLALDGYEDEAVALFTALPSPEKATLFASPTADLQPQVENVIEAVYIHTTIEETAVLTVMSTALRSFDRLDNPALLPEIESWLQGRTAVSQNDFSAAQLAYSVALSLNEDNPATRYERALVALALPDDATALSDLTILLDFDEQWQARVHETVSQNPQLAPLITVDGSQFAELAVFIPTPTAASPAPTSTRTPSPEPTVEENGVGEETAVLLQTLPSIPQTAPSGSIVYTCFVDGVDQICTVGVDGENGQQLTFTNATNWTGSWIDSQGTILFSSAQSGAFSLYEMDVDGENPRQLLPSTSGDYAPIASPNGTQIAFAHAENGSLNIWIMGRDGNDTHALTTIIGEALSPAWSPDGTQIAYAQQLAGEDRYTLVVMNVDDGEKWPFSLPLTDIGGHVDWSPDGQWLLFDAGESDDHDIYLAAVDGSTYYQVTDGGDNVGAAFLGGGNWIAFTSSRDGDNEIYLVRLDGTGLTRLTDNDSSDWQPR